MPLLCPHSIRYQGKHKDGSILFKGRRHLSFIKEFNYNNKTVQYSSLTLLGSKEERLPRCI